MQKPYQMATDWKDILASMTPDVPQAPESDGPTVPADEKPRQKGKLKVVLDKKGRKGKMATIIEGFDIPDEDVADIAKSLKQKLAVGGSSRDGEILLQGDVKGRCESLLKEMGFKL